MRNLYLHIKANFSFRYISEDDFKSITGNESRNELFGAEMRRVQFKRGKLLQAV